MNIKSTSDPFKDWSQRQEQKRSPEAWKKLLKRGLDPLPNSGGADPDNPRYFVTRENVVITVITTGPKRVRRTFYPFGGFNRSAEIDLEGASSLGIMYSYPSPSPAFPKDRRVRYDKIVAVEFHYYAP